MTIYDVCTVRYETVSLDDNPNGKKEAVPSEYYIDGKNIAVCEMPLGKGKVLYFETNRNGKKINVFLSSYLRGEQQMFFLCDKRLDAYTHWVDYYHMGYMDLQAFHKIINGDNLQLYYDEADIQKDKRVKLFKYTEQKIEKHIPQALKDDVNDAARKKDARALINKYFGSAAGV